MIQVNVHISHRQILHSMSWGGGRGPPMIAPPLALKIWVFHKNEADQLDMWASRGSPPPPCFTIEMLRISAKIHHIMIFRENAFFRPYRPISVYYIRSRTMFDSISIPTRLKSLWGLLPVLKKPYLTLGAHRMRET